MLAFNITNFRFLDLHTVKKRTPQQATGHSIINDKFPEQSSWPKAAENSYL